MKVLKALFLVGLLLAGQAFAATLSERTYKRLTAIHELMGRTSTAKR